MLKMKRRVMPPPPPEYAYAERVGGGTWTIEGEVVSAGQLVERFEPLVPDARLEDDLAQEIEARARAAALEPQS